MRFLTPCLVFSQLVMLTGCGSSSDDTSSTYTSSYIQLYNGSANSANTRLILTDSDDSSYLIGSASYTDATSLVDYTPDTYQFTLSRLNSSGDDVSVLESEIELKQSYKHLLLLSDDYASPDLLHIAFLRDDSLTDNFKLYVANLLSADHSYDLYISNSEQAFADATLVTTLSYQQISEPVEFALGNYKIYLTDAGSREPVFISPTYHFSYLTEYVLVPRLASGPLRGNIAVDIIGNSTTVSTLSDLDAVAQFRLYNSIDNLLNTQVMLNNETLLTELSSDTFSDYVQLDAADYRLTATDSSNAIVIKNALLTLNQGESKAMVLYTNEYNAASAIVVEESLLPQIYDFDINVVNVIADYTALSLYFVAPSQTIDTTDLYISSLKYAAQTAISLPDGEYRVLLVHTDSNSNKTLLAETDFEQFVTGSNYLLIAEPDENYSYKLSLLR
ncbi:DUF4397 domain-containing protein [Rheinheimera maricola]|uniref:DUF4397 domain-containing protein n=1 Tax=Rheinheimera maricola TaxID=2793282 RepID=A0ABS7XE71_9GAMM|nr:DUF4397 domain-containing protein [Rheinheimera maricola]MBZ9612887.1 hypothetical protein [Rheinheimera maricola]